MIPFSKKNFSTGVAVTFAARLAMTANSVVAGVVVARLLGAESLGAYLVLTAAIQILIQTSGFSLHIANTYFTARSPEKLPSVAVNSAVFAVVSGGVGSAIVLVGASQVLPGVPFELALIGLVAVPFQLITSYALNLFLAQREIRRFNLIDLVSQSFVLVNAVVALAIVGGSLWLLVSLNTAAAFAMAVAASVMIYRFGSSVTRAAWQFDLALLGKMLGYSAKGFVLWASIFALYRIDLIIVNYFAGSGEAAVYAVATQCTLFLLLLPHVTSQLLQARVAGTEDVNAEFTCGVARTTVLLLILGCAVSVPGAFLVSMLYGSGFETLPHLLWILLPGVLFIGVQQVIAQYFLGTGIPAKVVPVWLVVLIISIAADVLIVPGYGAAGAALVATICYVIGSIVMFGFFRSITGQPFAAFLVPRRDDLAQLLRSLRIVRAD